MYIYLNVCKKLLISNCILYTNSLICLEVYKKKIIKKYFKKMFTNRIYLIYVYAGFGIRKPTMVDMP